MQSKANEMADDRLICRWYAWEPVGSSVRMVDDAGTEFSEGVNAQTIVEPNGRYRVSTSARLVAADQVCLMERSDG